MEWPPAIPATSVKSSSCIVYLNLIHYTSSFTVRKGDHQLSDGIYKLQNFQDCFLSKKTGPWDTSSCLSLSLWWKKMANLAVYHQWWQYRRGLKDHRMDTWNDGTCFLKKVGPLKIHLVNEIILSIKSSVPSQINLPITLLRDAILVSNEALCRKHLHGVLLPEHFDSTSELHRNTNSITEEVAADRLTICSWGHHISGFVRSCWWKHMASSSRVRLVMVTS